MPEFAVPTVFTVKEQLTAFFSKGEVSANKFETSVNAAFKRTGKEASLFKQILGGVTLANLASKGVSELGGFIKGIPEQLSAMAEKGEALGKTAQIIGVNTDELQRFNYAAKMSDISVDGMQASLKKMNNGLAQLKFHQGAIETGLKRIDPQLMMQLRHTTDSKDAFLAVAAAMQRTESPQKRAAIAMAVFGKAGQDMIPMLLKGKEGVAELMAETDKYSGIMSKEAIESSAQYSDALKKTSGVIQSLKSAAITPLLTAITPYLDEMVEWVNTNRVMLKQDIKGFVTGLTQGIKVAVPILRDVLWVVKNIGPPVLAAATAFTVLKGSLMGAATAGPALLGKLNNIGFALQAFKGGAATFGEALKLGFGISPIQLVCGAIAVAVGLFVLLSSKMGGAGNAAMFLGQTLLKALLTPVNLLMYGVQGLLTLISKIPGVGNALTPALDAVKNFQTGMNKTLTGSAGMFDYAGTYEANLSADKKAERKAPNAGAVALQARMQANVRVDNSAAPGVTSRVTVAPAIQDDRLGANP
jgi:hypothetical protein